jgi:hypothetical protein
MYTTAADSFTVCAVDVSSDTTDFGKKTVTTAESLHRENLGRILEPECAILRSEVKNDQLQELQGQVGAVPPACEAEGQGGLD